MTFAEATWRLGDRAGALRALRDTSELELRPEGNDVDEHVFDWFARRRDLIARRPLLPPGAIVMEGGPVTLNERGEIEGADAASLGTFTLREETLEVSCLSAQRLDGAVALVERNLGPLATDLQRRLRSIDEAREELDAGPAAAGARSASSERYPRTVGASDARLQAFFYRRWIDDPNSHLGGLSPRQAADRPEHRDQFERQLRLLEHHDARDHHASMPGPEVAWLRRELRLEQEPAAR